MDKARSELIKGYMAKAKEMSTSPMGASGNKTQYASSEGNKRGQAEPTPV